MPCHPDRVRSAPLPAGYQFGDAASLRQALPRLVDAVERVRVTIGATIFEPLLGPRISGPGVDSYRWRAIVEFGAHNYATDFSGMGVSDAVDVRLPSTAPQWRAPHENAAERIARYQAEYDTGRDCGDEA